MPIPSNKLCKTLTNKFKFELIGGTKHERVALFIEDKQVATTGFSRGSKKDISDSLLGQMAREIFVTPGFLKKMNDCTKDYDDYVAYLEEIGKL
jgi:hypothetical protein